MNWIISAFLHYTGADDVTGAWYGFWSGFGSDLGEVLLLGGLFAMYRHHNCQVKGCWRLGRQVHGTHDVLCRKHHSEASQQKLG